MQAEACTFMRPSRGVPKNTPLPVCRLPLPWYPASLPRAARGASGACGRRLRPCRRNSSLFHESPARPVPSVVVTDHQARTLAALQSFTTVKFSKPLVLKTIRNAGGCGYGYPPSSGLKAILELPTSVPLRRGDTNRETNSTSPALPLCEISVRPGFSTLGDPPRSPCAPAGASRLALNGLGCASPLPGGEGHYQRRFCVKSSPQSKQFGKTGNPIPRCLGPGAEGCIAPPPRSEQTDSVQL